MTLSFRQKTFFSYATVFVTLTILTFPLISHIVEAIAVKAMEDRADEVIAKIKTAPNDERLIQQLKDQKFLLFFRVSVITNERKVLYDSYTKRLLGSRFSQEYVIDHPEVLEAFEKGSGYKEGYSNILKQRFSYLAKAFDFHGKTYVLRTAFPYQYFSDLTNDIEIAVICLIFTLLLTFSLVTWFIINHFTSPIQQIIRAVAPYQEGKLNAVPEITLTPINRNDEFSTLATTLNTFHHKLLEMRRDFIANASHELKTPITIIRGFAETLHDNPDLPIAIRADITRKIVSNCQRMTVLIKDLLILSDIENIPAFRLVPCHLEDVIEACCDTLRDVFPDVHITIHKKPEQTIDLLADPSLLELAMMNLIENAAKYSKHPASIDIEMKKDKNSIEVTIADKGIGIPKHDLEHIFDRFYTVDKAHSQKLGGSGLGLSIVQTIIHKHFGKISVSSQVGQGTAFKITLPANRGEK